MPTPQKNTYRRIRLLELEVATEKLMRRVFCLSYASSLGLRCDALRTPSNSPKIMPGWSKAAKSMSLVGRVASVSGFQWNKRCPVSSHESEEQLWAF